MNDSSHSSIVDSDEDPRVLEAVKTYLAEVESGRQPDRRELEERYPELIEAMTPYLDALNVLQAAIPHLHDPSESTRGRHKSESIVTSEPLGDFRIVREIGRGGMGVVYEAVQLSLGRRVALKVLPFAAAFDNKQLQRFRHEAQAAAQLHHPHIVPVFGVGCERGTHYFAMQLIEGQNLAEMIRQLRGEAVTVRERDVPDSSHVLADEDPPSVVEETYGAFGTQLTTVRTRRVGEYFKTVARLIAQAADGLDYAHGMGVVHRDVKPANLLVDDAGDVWVTDFGLAQLQTGVNLTHTGDLLGTLRYMSPEQAGGQHLLLDQRTDVYSLGATLYEFLTLRPVFDGTDRTVLLRQIVEETPVALRSINPAIPVELETITLKALGKAPSERYATAKEMADDLRRFLENRPIQARPPSMLERASKWGRRHRAFVASALATLVMSVAALLVSTVLIARAYDRERERANEAALQYQRAEQSFRQARKAVDEFTRISEEQLRNHPMLESVRVRMLEAALAYYQDFVDQQSNDLLLKAELEVSRAKVESILDELTIVVDAARYGLLQHQSVQDELQLTLNQRVAVEQFEEQWRDALRESSRMKRQDWETSRLELAQSQRAAIDQLLTPPQLERFHQLTLQMQGPAAFLEPELIAALELSPDQVSQIQTVMNDLNVSWMGPGGGPPPPLPPPTMSGSFRHPPSPRRSAEDDILASTTNEIVGLLTESQKKKWQQLTGATFRFEGPPHRMGSRIMHFRDFENSRLPESVDPSLMSD